MSRDERYRRLMNSMRWRNVRRAVLTEHPLCEECKRRGIVQAAVEVHHITPIESYFSIEQMEAAAYNINNLQALCHECHIEAHKALRSRDKRAMAERHKSRAEEFNRNFFGTTPTDENVKKFNNEAGGGVF